MTILLRKATFADTSQVVALWLEVFSVFRRQLHDWGAFRHELQNTMLTGTGIQFIVAETDGQMVGVAGYISPEHEKDAMFPPQSAAIRLLAVAASHRGRGIGNDLLQECIRLARKDRARYLALHTTAYFTAAIAMYQRTGFRHDGHFLQENTGAPCVRLVLDL